MPSLDLMEKALLFSKSPRTACRYALRRMNVGRKQFPGNITLFVTERCNFSCPMCNMSNSREAARSKDISLDHVKRLASECRKWSPQYVVMGGEPTVNKELYEIIDILDGSNSIVSMISNGLLLDKQYKDIVDSGLSALTISIDGWNEETQYQRGLVRGSFDRILGGIQNLIDYRESRSLPLLKVTTVISKNNFMHLDKIGDVLLELGITRWGLLHYSFYTEEVRQNNEAYYKDTGIGQCIGGHNIGGSPYFNKDECEFLKAKLSEIRRKFSQNINIIDIDWDMNVDSYYSLSSPKDNSDCCMPYEILQVRADGDITICYTGYKLGNIAEVSLRDVWVGGKMKFFRQELARRKTFPMCFRCPFGMSSFRAG